MTVNEAINLTELRMPGNSYGFEEKLKWLTSVEVMWNDFLKQLGFECESVKIGINDDERKLMINEPYDEVYVIWLMMKMHFYNGEIELYNNSAEAFNNTLEQAKKAFIRENRSKRSIGFNSYKEV